MSDALQLADTVPVVTLRHRLALGLSCLDALARSPSGGALRIELRAIGPYPLAWTLERHRADRHAARYAGEIRRRLDQAVAAGGGIDWALDLFGGPADSRPGYRPESDPRRHVPRRLAITPVLDGDEPAATPLNIRTPWLWPGAAYPLPANATALRGRVLRGPDLASAAPARWARVVATVPASETDFSLATRVGHGHADERGEYVLALDARAVSGAALSNPVQVRLWAFTTPAALPVDPLDPLADLPREACGTDVVNDVLRGIAIPPAYSASVSQLAAVRLGETASGAVATLLVS